MDDLQELQSYVASANEAIEINLVRPGKSPGSAEYIDEEPFHPNFTYEIFGQDEAIFGYKGLDIKLTFRAYDLRPALEVRFKDKFKPIGETEAMDVEGPLRKFLPESAFGKNQAFVEGELVADESVSEWKPPGVQLTSYRHEGKKYEIWQSNLVDPKARSIFENGKILIPMNIEGGTCQELEGEDMDWTLERWKVFFLYEVTSSHRAPYVLTGFATSYRIWVFPTPQFLSQINANSSTGPLYPTDVYPPPTAPPHPSSEPPTFDAVKYSPLKAPSRERISQFVILPPFQGRSHGSRLYNCLMRTFRADPYVVEVTVEDPNENFDDLRDWCDIAYLRTDPDFAALSVPTELPPDALKPDGPAPADLILAPATVDALRRKHRVAPRQFARVAEMHLLSKIPRLHRSAARISRKEKSSHPMDRVFFFWRLLVKTRIYAQNADQMADMEREERLEKVEAAMENVLGEYEEKLEGAERRRTRMRDAGEDEEMAEAEPAAGQRRKRVVEDDEETDEENGEGQGKQEGRLTVEDRGKRTKSEEKRVRTV
ncbi:acyl-CoA N-acyltransferase [Lineolata rhizophorae]|uniref:Histone acetyltransferase type B catalytic subunit n=1 Tax=Lineolata rhizophorae TaxID=578093 RepID=A0A6A6NXQ0_9PEZI|nr:acyl-CoA N-acyltransferase [Lineolata rhizophorae]